MGEVYQGMFFFTFNLFFCTMSFLNRHIIEEHLKIRKNKSRFLCWDTAEFVVRDLLFGCWGIEEKPDKISPETRTVLLKTYMFPIGVGFTGRLLFTGKAVISSEGVLITAYPTESIY